MWEFVIYTLYPDKKRQGNFKKCFFFYKLLISNLIFFVHIMPEECKNATITRHFAFVFEKTSVRGNQTDHRDAVVFQLISVHA